MIGDTERCSPPEGCEADEYEALLEALAPMRLGSSAGFDVDLIAVGEEED